MTWLRIYCCGFAMGVVELIPGFSGGTVAFITGIYQRLVKALGAFNLAWLKSLMQLVRGRAQRQQVLGPIDAGFLLVLVLGMFTAWLLTARLIQWLLITHKLLLWAGLFGLVFGVILTMIARHKQQHTAVSWLLAVSGFGLGLLLTSVQLPPVPANIWWIAVMGGIASCAWILPGLSGSFLLLIAGFYHPYINAIADGNWAFLAPFALGAVICLPWFSALLGRLLAARYAPTTLFLTAFLLGSLKLLWPWQRTLSYYFSPEGGAPMTMITEPILPQTYAALTGEDPQTLAVVTLMIGAAFIVVLLEGYKKGRQEAEAGAVND